MSAAMPNQNLISQETSTSKKYRVNNSDLGNGYTQRFADGLNNKVSTWVIQWNNLDESQRDANWAAFDSVGAWDYLTWTAFGDSTEKKWRIVSDPTENPISGDLYTMTLTVEETFDLI